MDRFDMVVLGAGPADEKGAAQAASLGERVAMVERSDLLGGATWTQAALSDHFIHTPFNVPTPTDTYRCAAYDGLQRSAAARPAAWEDPRP